MTNQKEVQRKKYPPKVDFTAVLKGFKYVSLLDLTFHSLMATLLVTGLIIDLLGPLLGGWLEPIRSIAHGYIGALFVLVFVAYIGNVAYSKKMRMVLTSTNYVDFIFYTVLIITGIARASINQPWVDLFPTLVTVFAPVAIYAPQIHVITTYVWIVFSIVFPGGLLHGLASVYLITYLKKRRQGRLEGR